VREFLAGTFRAAAEVEEYPGHSGLRVTGQTKLGDVSSDCDEPAVGIGKR
jgi:hypothetical protein